MKRTFSLLTAAALLAILSLTAFSQTGKTSADQFAAPVEWKKYKVAHSELSVSMPKKPMVTSMSDPCTQMVGKTYSAYAGQTVYELSWRTKTDAPKPATCRVPLTFGIEDYDRRLAALSAGKAVKSDASFMGGQGYVFRTESDAFVETKWLFWTDGGLLEMTVARRKDVSPTGEDRFWNSLGLKDASAQDAGDGSVRVLGDAGEAPKAAGTTTVPDDALVVRSKPRPGYTEVARTKSTVGSIVLKVEFLANGGIGAVMPIKELENGLTEQAILAAQRITFLPARAHGVPVTVTKQLEYSFAIY